MIAINKITRYTFFTMAFGAAVCSCDLDVTPTSNIATETFWQTEKDAWYNLNAVYSASIPGVSPHADAYTSDAYCRYAHESNASAFQQNALHSGMDEGYSFTTIRKQNVFLENVDNVSMDETLKARFKAEVRAMRAWTYLGLTTTFGKVPVITTVPAYDSPNIPRDEVSKVREFILTELTEAAKVLPEKYEGGYPNEKGRITKYAALAIKARAALNFGDYALAEETAKYIMDHGGFSLFKLEQLNEKQQKEANEMSLYVDFDKLGIDKDKFVKGMFSYEALWHDENANPDNPEYIMTRQYSPVDPDHQDYLRYTSLRPNQLGGWSSVTPTQNLVDTYWSADGKEPVLASMEERAEAYKVMKKDLDNYKVPEGDKNPKFISFTKGLYKSGKLKDYAYMQQFRNRDARMYVSILFPFKSWYETNYGTNFFYEWIKNGNNESMTGFNFRKMVALENDSQNNGNATGDFPCIRYAEILLIYAEARTQNSGYDTEVEKALNELRDRCGMPNVPSGLGKEAALDLISKERRIELVGEGILSDDLYRCSDEYWNKLMNNVDLLKPDGELIIHMKWDSRMHLRPIPQSAMDLNPLLREDQNPGY